MDMDKGMNDLVDEMMEGDGNAAAYRRAQQLDECGKAQEWEVGPTGQMDGLMTQLRRHPTKQRAHRPRRVHAWRRQPRAQGLLLVSLSRRLPLWCGTPLGR